MARCLLPARLVPARLRGRRPSGWTALVPVVALAAGLLFATSGRTAQGTDLRAGEVTQLSELIQQRQHRHRAGRASSSPISRARWTG